MILSDRDIKLAIKAGEITIDPFDERNLQPASVDLHLGRFFTTFNAIKEHVIDPRVPLDGSMSHHEVRDGKPFVMHPGGFALGHIAEVTGVCDSMVGRLEGKSSVGRLGMLIHVTAGFLDPGNSLHMTLELHNTADIPVLLFPGMPIAQMAFERLSSPVEHPYGSSSLTSKYSGDTGPVASQMWKNFNPETGEWK